MPIYEYEPLDHECLICNGRIEVLQSVDDPACEYCPTCGLPVRRIVSKATLRMAADVTPGAAEAKGFTTYRRVEKGRWEKVAGEGGVDAIIGQPEDIAAVEAERKPAKSYDLDAQPDEG